MLVELAVRDLGVIEDLRLVLGPGMTALTGETGAGKTMVVEAIDLLVGGRADGVLVRAGAGEAVIEGRFADDDGEVVLTRVVPRAGRSRAYVDGRMATARALADHGARAVDLHGQHTHQSLLAGSVQRQALDRFGAIDLQPRQEARAMVAGIDRQLADLGGDPGARARELDLLRFQVAELDRAALDDPDEDDRLDAEEDRLADAVAHQEAAAAASAAIGGDGAAQDALAGAIAALDGRSPFAELGSRLRSVATELSDVAAAVRDAGEAVVDDPERLAAIRERRQLLADLRRKYGDGRLEGAMVFADEARARLVALERADHTAATLDQARTEAVAALAQAEAELGAARRRAGPELAAAILSHLVELAMPRAEVVVEVGPDRAGDQVRFLLAANPGSPPQPLNRVASGGELARVMLAVRLVLTSGPPTLVFDEVDAGIGGQAALAVGRSLAAVGADHQVLVVTHLPQVAAFADAQVRIAKADDHDTAVARAEVLGDDDRVVELSRMLSGTPESTATRDAASDLLATAAKERAGKPT